MDHTARLNFPYIHPNQAQKEITHNEALTMLDVLVHPIIQSVTESPPADASLGQLYIVGKDPTAEFADHENKIAQKLEFGWRFTDPPKWLQVTMEDNGTIYRFNGNDWEQLDILAAPIKHEPLLQETIKQESVQ